MSRLVAAVLIYPPMLIPAAGLYVSRDLQARLLLPGDWATFWTEPNVLDGYAIVFFCSTLINAVVVSTRLHTPPTSYTQLLRLPLALVVLAALGVGWVLTIAISKGDASVLEAFAALAVAGASIVVFVLAMRPDATSNPGGGTAGLEFIQASLGAPPTKESR